MTDVATKGTPTEDGTIRSLQELARYWANDDFARLEAMRVGAAFESLR